MMGTVKENKNTISETRSPIVLTASNPHPKNPELRRLFWRYGQ